MPGASLYQIKGKCNFIMPFCIICIKEEIDAIEKLTPGLILMFTTGTPSAPVLGFNPIPSIKFVHDDSTFIPSAHTCGNILYIYVNEILSTITC